MLPFMPCYSHRSFNFAQPMTQNISCSSRWLLMAECCSIFWFLLTYPLVLSVYNILIMNQINQNDLLTLIIEHVFATLADSC